MGYKSSSSRGSSLFGAISKHRSASKVIDGKPEKIQNIYFNMKQVVSMIFNVYIVFSDEGNKKKKEKVRRK